MRSALVFALCVLAPIAAHAEEIVAETAIYLQPQPQQAIFVGRETKCRYIGHTDYNQTNFNFSILIDFKNCRGRQVPFKANVTVTNGQLLRPSAPTVAPGDIMVLIPVS